MASASRPNRNLIGGLGQGQGQNSPGPHMGPVRVQAQASPNLIRIAPEARSQNREANAGGRNRNQALADINGGHHERPPSPAGSGFQDEEDAECVASRRPLWLWFLAISDMSIVAIILTTSGSEHTAEDMVKGDNTTRIQVGHMTEDESSMTSAMRTLFHYDNYESWTTSGLIVSIALLSQFFMGFMLFIALCIPSDNVFVICLSGYLYGSYFILCKVFFSLFSSVTLASKTKKWGRIVGNLMTLLIRLPVTMMIQDVLGMCNSAEPEQPEQEERNFSRRLHPHEHRHLPLTFARKPRNGDEAETSL